MKCALVFSNIFVETMILFQDLFEVEIFCDNVKVLTVTFYQCKTCRIKVLTIKISIKRVKLAPNF